MNRSLKISQAANVKLVVERTVLDLESDGQGSIPTRGNIFSTFYNLNLHNIARSERIGFKMTNPINLHIYKPLHTIRLWAQQMTVAFPRQEAGRTLTSDWSVISFAMDVYEKFLVVVWRENSD